MTTPQARNSEFEAYDRALLDRWNTGTEHYAQAATELSTYCVSNRLLAEIAGLEPGMTLLDLGCGSGATSLAAFAYQPELQHGWAVDWSASMLKEARRVLADLPISLVQACAGSLAQKLEAHSIDRAVCNAALFQFRDYGGVLEDLRRVLRPTGQFAFSLPEATAGPVVAHALAKHQLYPLRPSSAAPSHGASAAKPVGRRGMTRSLSLTERIAATEAAGWGVVESQLCQVAMSIEDHVRWLMLPMFRHPSWAQVTDDELEARLLAALRSEGCEYPVAWRVLLVGPRPR